MVNSLCEYRLAATCAEICVRAMLRPKSASVTPLSDLFRLFRMHSCSTCKEQSGNMLSLLTWQRCGSLCLRKGSSEVAVEKVEGIYIKYVFHLPFQKMAFPKDFLWTPHYRADHLEKIIKHRLFARSLISISAQRCQPRASHEEVRSAATCCFPELLCSFLQRSEHEANSAWNIMRWLPTRR